MGFWLCGIPIASTVNVKRFAGLNICSFSPRSFARKYFRGASTTSVYYLTLAKYSQKTLTVLLKNHEYCKSFAQQIFPRLHSIKSKQTRCMKKFKFEKGNRDHSKK